MEQRGRAYDAGSTMKQADFDRAAKLIEGFVPGDLEEGLGNAFVFGPIIVEPDFDEDDSSDLEYVWVNIIFDGNLNEFDHAWTAGLIGRLRSRLEKADITAFPITRFIERSEWEDHLRRGRRTVATE